MLGLRQALDARLLPEARTTELSETLIEMFAELRRDVLEERAPIRVARPG
jgi:hypothetical protein